jgi:hypothetical protein
VSRPPFPDAAAGDVLEVLGTDYRGDHRHHAKRPLGTDYLRCVFSTAPEPACTSAVAIGGSLLIFSGDPARLVAATGAYAGMSGSATTKEAPGGTDAVVALHR